MCRGVNFNVTISLIAEIIGADFLPLSSKKAKFKKNFIKSNLKVKMKSLQSQRQIFGFFFKKIILQNIKKNSALNMILFLKKINYFKTTNLNFKST